MASFIFSTHLGGLMAIDAYIKQLLNIRNKRSQLGTLIEEAEAIAPTEIALANTHILVGAATGKAADVAVSGDATMANTGALTVLNASVIGKVLTGFVGGSGFSAIAATDSILQAFQKAVGNLAAKVPNKSLVYSGQATTAGGDVNETIAQVGILNTDLVLVQVASGTGYVVSAISAADSITVVMSENPGAATKLNWFVYR